MMKDHYNPPGIEFCDAATNRNVKLCEDGPWKGWLAYKHPDGQWVSWRKATEADFAAIRNAPN